jgi:hypothetical protein
MTPSSAREARIHLISEGVTASYIHDISTRGAVGVPAAAAGRSPQPAGAGEEVLVPARRRPPHTLRAWT